MFNIETTPIDVQEAADIERAVSAFAQSPNSGMITALSAAALEHKDSIINLQHSFDCRWFTPIGFLRLTAA